MGSFDLGGPEDPVFGGEYTATKDKYRVTYAFNEHASLLVGEVALTNEATGGTVIYGPGDSWIIAQSTSILWGIRSAIVRKSYLAVVSAA